MDYFVTFKNYMREFFITYLIERNVDKPVESFNPNVPLIFLNITEIPIQFTIEHKNIPLTKLLLENGANPYISDQQGLSILTRLAYKKKILEYKEILFDILKLDPTHPDAHGRNIYYIAHELQDKETIKFLNILLAENRDRFSMAEFDNVIFDNFDIKLLGKKINLLVRSSLFIGSSNVAADRRRSGNWVESLIHTIRRDYWWEKGKVGLKSVKSSWILRFGARIQKRLGLRGLATEAANAVYNKVGNCGEMSYLGMYYLCYFFRTDPVLKQWIQKHDFVLRSVYLPEKLDHVFIDFRFRRKELVKRPIGFRKKLGWGVLFIDPWLNRCFGKSEFDLMRDEMAVRLVQEFPHRLEMDETAKLKESLPIQFRDEIIRYWTAFHFYDYMIKNKVTVKQFKEDFKIGVRFEEVVLKTIEDMDTLIWEFDEAAYRLRGKVSLIMPSTLQKEIIHAAKLRAGKSAASITSIGSSASSGLTKHEAEKLYMDRSSVRSRL